MSSGAPALFGHVIRGSKDDNKPPDPMDSAPYTVKICDGVQVAE